MKLYTIGHSNHTQEELLNLLVTHGINLVADRQVDYELAVHRNE